MASEDLLDELAGIAADAGSSLEPPGYQDVLQEVTATVRSLLGAAACSISVLDAATEELEFVAATGEGADEILGTRIPGSSGIAGWALASGQSITVGDVSRDPRFDAEVAESTGYVPSSVFAVPLAGETQPVGVLEVLDATRSPEDGATQELIALLVRQATLAVETSQLFEDLGKALFRSAASAAGEGDLGRALSEAAGRARGPARSMSELAAIFYELGRIGEAERAAAVRMLSAFLSYAGSRDPAS